MANSLELGVPGQPTIVALVTWQLSATKPVPGAAVHTYTIAGSSDGLR